MALRSNTKKAKENLKKYIVESTTFYVMDCLNDSVESEVSKNAYRIIKEDFERWFTGDYRYKRHTLSLQDLFLDWAMGLPCGSLFDFWTYEDNANPVNILGDILEETEEERNKYSEEQAARMLTYLIFREIWR